MEPFSVRVGAYEATTSLQVTSMDARLTNGLWTSFLVNYALGGQVGRGQGLHRYPSFQAHATVLWTTFFGQSLDTLPAIAETALANIRSFFFDMDWARRYDFLEFLATKRPMRGFTDRCNVILEREHSAYRFAGDHLVPIASAPELEAVTRAQEETGFERLATVHEHLTTAVQLLGDRAEPDYRNSVKESISAVESLVSIIRGKSDTLGSAIKSVNPSIHPALLSGISKIYGWTSDEDGVRHGANEMPNVTSEDAQFTLVFCSAVVSYLIAKQAKA